MTNSKTLIDDYIRLHTTCNYIKQITQTIRDDMPTVTELLLTQTELGLCRIKVA